MKFLLQSSRLLYCKAPVVILHSGELLFLFQHIHKWVYLAYDSFSKNNVQPIVQ